MRGWVRLRAFLDGFVQTFRFTLALQAYLVTSTEATIASVGSPPSITRSRWCLHHSLLRGPAGVFAAVRHQHPELRRDCVEPLVGEITALLVPI
jgi:hypothetical protein